MCEPDGYRSWGWKGWNRLPPTTSMSSTGPWLDLSHPLGDETPVPGVPRDGSPAAWAFPQARFERLRSMPDDPVNLSEMEMVVHFGTHVDAPIHFIADGPAFDEIPLERLYGPGRFVDLPCEPLHAISDADLAECASDVAEGDIVVLNTGWTEHAGRALYDEHPYLTADAAHWLLERNIKLLAVDFPSPDLPIAKRGKGFDWPVHHILLSHGILVAENLRLQPQLKGRPAEFVFAALNIAGSDGSPARVLGRTAVSRKL